MVVGIGGQHHVLCLSVVRVVVKMVVREDPENKPNLVKLQLSNVSPKTIYDNVFKVWIKNVKRF